MYIILIVTGLYTHKLYIVFPLYDSYINFLSSTNNNIFRAWGIRN